MQPKTSVACRSRRSVVIDRLSKRTFSGVASPTLSTLNFIPKGIDSATPLCMNTKKEHCQDWHFIKNSFVFLAHCIHYAMIKPHPRQNIHEEPRTQSASDSCSFLSFSSFSVAIRGNSQACFLCDVACARAEMFKKGSLTTISDLTFPRIEVDIGCAPLSWCRVLRALPSMTNLFRIMRCPRKWITHDARLIHSPIVAEDFIASVGPYLYSGKVT